MTIQELVTRFREISLNHKEIKSFHVGNSWDMSASKSSDIYPAVWCEFPVLSEYTMKDKSYTFSLDILALAKADNTEDELNITSQCEVIADELLQVFKLKIANLALINMSGLSVKAINADMAVGVRIDMKVTTNRACEPLNNFIETMDRL